jgi:hypothetical protein
VKFIIGEHTTTESGSITLFPEGNVKMAFGKSTKFKIFFG